MNWQWYNFNDLSLETLYDLLALRQQVFVLEQHCFYQDLDDVDKQALHLIAKQDNQIVAYLRLYQKDQHLSFGRVLTAKQVRGSGLGRQLVQQAVEFAQQHHPKLPIIISAQQHLEGFYASFGFKVTSEPYDDAGIMHVNMQL